jgi:hypothetical protein
MRLLRYVPFLVAPVVIYALLALRWDVQAFAARATISAPPTVPNIRILNTACLSETERPVYGALIEQQ